VAFPPPENRQIRVTSPFDRNPPPTFPPPSPGEIPAVLTRKAHAGKWRHRHPSSFSDLLSRLLNPNFFLEASYRHASRLQICISAAREGTGFHNGGNHCACAPDWREYGHLQPDDIRDRNSVLSALLIQAKRIFLPLFLT
jgi:hypothetical protein